MKKIRKITITIYVCMLLGILLLAGCGQAKQENEVNTFNHSMKDNTTVENNSEETSEEAEPAGTSNDYRSQYLIIGINSAEETLHVYKYANRMEYLYYYGMGTEFYNKYGDHTAIANFAAGDIVSLSGLDQEGKVLSIQKSNDVWVYDDVVNFDIDENLNVLSIADTNYKLDDETFIFSGNDIIKADDINEKDELTVIGVDKKILSVSVTSGQGILRLKNTELFEGSFMQLNNNIFTEITPDMELEVPEGEYTLTVANNGWGGSKEITIKRGETTVVNLDKIKGDGPKTGNILFEVDVTPAQIFIDNNEIDYTQPVELVYGAHSLVVMAEGYTTWSKTLYVNSPEATIIITLTNQESESTPESSSQKDNDKNKESENNDSNKSDSDKNDSDKNDSDKNDSDKKDSDSKEYTDEMLKDYLSTISELLDAID